MAWGLVNTDPKLTVLQVLGNIWNVIWRPEECTARAVYLSRILWLDKEWYSWRSCAIWLSFVYWFAVRRNRCFIEPCGYIFNWAWQLLKFGWAFFIFLNTPVLRVALVPPLSLPCRAGRSTGPPAEIPLLHLPLLCMLQGAITKNAPGIPVWWPSWGHLYVVLHAPHALV